MVKLLDKRQAVKKNGVSRTSRGVGPLRLFPT
jgi:hypothetical protein